MYRKIIKLPNTCAIAKIDSIDGKVFHVAIDQSSRHGILNFTHEINIRFAYNKSGSLRFKGGNEIASSDIIYTADKDGMDFFEFRHPGILDDILAARDEIIKGTVYRLQTVDTITLNTWWNGEDVYENGSIYNISTYIREHFPAAEWVYKRLTQNDENIEDGIICATPWFTVEKIVLSGPVETIK